MRSPALAHIAVALIVLFVLAACCGSIAATFPNGFGGDSGYPLGEYGAP